ncbi:MAG: UDP-N-acetylmuramoyl-L-alanyl-D-glutamate--2,6-diaminopimelate ligase [Candidatus Aminicenantes bacterium]|nr:MAG: UDP-N-acetylmuramoyl-L-alanyl-D-glutamate--2,6-diaminopimelate ligase [Candidatus Aminicenantes bacterium]
MKLKDVLAGVPLLGFNGNKTEDIQGIAYSSKNVQPGFLFTALKGMKTDGLEFIEEALLHGAVAVLSDRPKPENFTQTWIQVSDIREALALSSANFYSHPSRKMKVIGITGTKGKTTITYILEEILKKSRFVPGVIGTISYRGSKMTIPAERTTPEAPDIQRILCEMLSHGVTHCIMEVSSHALDLKRVMGIAFDVVAFVNLSGDHLDYHKTMEKYFEAKKRLFFLNHKKRMAVVNEDDPWGKKLISQLPTEALTFGIDPGAMVRVENFSLNAKGIAASVKYPKGRLSISSPLLGKPNLYNILASVALALTLNLPPSAIKEGIASLKGVPGRFEEIENSLGLHIFVDYAHTDDALKNLLETVRELDPKRIILVFGAGGDRDKTKRPRMGEAAGTLADWTIITSDNPRSEEPMAIISDIEKGIQKTGTQNYQIIPDRREAIEQALSLGEKGDYILVAGKGHEDYQIIKDKITHFDDAEVIREILQAKGES